MKQYTKWVLMLSVLLIVFFCLPSLVYAQPEAGGDPDVVPVDGGLTILAAAGVAYSVKKLKDYRKKRNEKSGYEK